MSKANSKRRFLGITVLADFVLSEGIDQVLEQVVDVAGATAVATNPTVTTEAPEGEGSFQPPADAGSSPRLFDRPLFGKRSLWVQGAPSYRPTSPSVLATMDIPSHTRRTRSPTLLRSGESSGFWLKPGPGWLSRP